MNSYISCLLVVFYLIASVIAAKSALIYDSCEAPDKHPGKCITIHDCPSLLKLFNDKPIPQKNVELLRQSQCGYEDNSPKVCCPLNAAEAKATLQSRLLPQPLQECGSFSEDRIVISKLVELDSYPWTVLLEYRTPTGTQFHCGGVLINDKYVLTAAHCVSGPNIRSDWTLSSIRLGENNLTTDEDCSTLDILYNLCADPPINVNIEEKIVHEQYDSSNANQYHDIALLRLAHNVTSTEFVSPICLQSLSEEELVLHPGNMTRIVGWGADESRLPLNERKIAEVQVEANSRCESAYQSKGIRLREDQLCASVVEADNRCFPDSGGVLMNSLPKSWSYFAVAVKSFGNPDCTQDSPAVYTNVHAYLPWIVSKLKP